MKALSHLGIDIGGTKVAFRIEQDGRDPFQTSFRLPPALSVERDLAALAMELTALRQRWGAPPERVGVAVPATLDRKGVVEAWPNRPSWVGLHLADALRAMLPEEADIRCADDGDLAAVAEAAAAGVADLAYLGIGTGVGGGVVLDGKPCPGPDRGSCEVGHIVVDGSGPRCSCGRRGCVQAFAGGPAVLRRAAELRGAEVEFTDLQEGLTAGAGWAEQALNEACQALALAVVNLGELVHPDLVLIGGGFAAGFPTLVPGTAHRAAQLARPGSEPIPVRAAVLGGLSSLHGAVLLARS